jgi:hypothetical protein
MRKAEPSTFDTELLPKLPITRLESLLPLCYRNRPSHPDPSRGWFLRFVSSSLGSIVVGRVGLG